MVLSATFVVFPLVLRDVLLIAPELHWQIYLPVFVLSVVGLVPLIVIAEKYRHTKGVFLVGITLIVIAELGLAWTESYTASFIALVLFFSGTKPTTESTNTGR